MMAHCFGSDWHFDGHEDTFPHLNDRHLTGPGLISEVWAVRNLSCITNYHFAESPPDPLGPLRS